VQVLLDLLGRAVYLEKGWLKRNWQTLIEIAENVANFWKALTSGNWQKP
jgi:hypothetical protein